MAKDLTKRGKKILIAGRAEEKLKIAAEEIGAAGYYFVDIGNEKGIDSFIARLINEHPELDCVINNAGVHKPFQIFGPDYGFDLPSADQEIDINIRGPMHLIIGLIQKHFHKLNSAVLANVSSVLGFVPFSIINPVYNGTKAWIHSFSVNLRTQLAKAGSKIKIVEIVPPTVETDLHRDRVDPDDIKKASSSMALSVDEFRADVVSGWEANEDIIAPGMASGIVKSWEESLRQRYVEQTK